MPAISNSGSALCNSLTVIYLYALKEKRIVAGKRNRTRIENSKYVYQLKLRITISQIIARRTASRKVFILNRYPEVVCELLLRSLKSKYVPVINIPESNIHCTILSSQKISPMIGKLLLSLKNSSKNLRMA